VYKTIYEAHLEYLELGWDTVPIPPKADGTRSKVPVDEGWQTLAAARQFPEDRYRQPNANMGIQTGGKDNLTDVDVDMLLALPIAAEFLHALPEMRKPDTCTFGRKSKPDSHYFFYTDEALPSEKYKDPTTRQCIIEYRCVNQDGGRGYQTVVPPSIHETGEQISFAHPPSEIVTVNAQKLRRCVRIIAAVTLMARYFPIAERHYTKRAWANVFCKAGVPLNSADVYITRAYANSRNTHGRSQSKDLRDIKEVYNINERGDDTHLYGFPKLLEHYDEKVLNEILRLLGIEWKQQAQSYALTDLGNALRFVDKFAKDIRYCPEDKSWYVWDGKRWALDTVNRAQAYAQTISADIEAQAQALKASEDDETATKQKSAISKWAHRSQMSERIGAMVRQSSSMPSIIISKDKFETHDHLLNCPNGIVDLYTGALLPHDRNLFLSRLCPIEYDPTARSEDWDNFIETVTRKHPDLPEFLQTFCGYCAQGNKCEERFVITYGVARTGKGTFWTLITKTLGSDYVQTLSINSLIRQDRGGGAASPDLAELERCRLAVTSEPDRKAKLQENLLKAVSGNDPIVTRKLYSAQREFLPKFQLVFQTNHRPEFSNDDGINRRALEIPFDNKIEDDPKAKLDPGLKNRLAEDVKVKKAVLAWIVAGCVKWRQTGLQPPPCVLEATADLMRQNDVLAEFAGDCLITDPDAFVEVADMRTVYMQWTLDNRKDALKDRDFNDLLNDRGFRYMQKKVSGRNMKVWSGVKFTGYAKKFVQTDEEQLEEVKEKFRKIA
jgi:P4 family phage/plasmid primase-like protien